MRGREGSPPPPTKRRQLRRILRLVLLVVALAVLSVPAWVPGRIERRLNGRTAPPRRALAEKARALHGELFVADLHADSLLWRRDLLQRSSRGAVDVPRLLDGNVALQVFSVVTVVPRGAVFERREDALDLVTPLMIAEGRFPTTWGGLGARALSQARQLARTARRSGGRLVLVQTRADLDALVLRTKVGEDVVGGILALEGMHPLEGDLGNLDVLHRAGVRMIGLAHFLDNEVAGSLHGPARTGLTSLGEDVVRRMEGLGIAVDLAHCSPRTFDDVMKQARRPVVVSHAGVRGTCDSSRNLSRVGPGMPGPYVAAKKSLPLSSTTMKAGKSSTSMR